MNFYFKIIKNIFIIFFSFIIYHGCEGSSSSSVIENPLGDFQFTYLQDESLIQDVLSEKIQCEGIEKDDIEEYSRKFMLAESERYFYRDNEGEPNSYNFAIKSNHYYN